MLYLSGIILACFLALLLLLKKNKTGADIVLSVWLSVIAFHLLTHYFFVTGKSLCYPTLVVISRSLPLLHGPFLFLYTWILTSERAFDKRLLFHFFPFVLSLILFSSFHFLSYEDKVDLVRSRGKGYEVQAAINFSAVCISGVIYVVLSLHRLRSYRRSMVEQFSNTERINFYWLSYLIAWMVFIWVTFLVFRDDRWIFGAASLFVIWVGYFGIRQVKVFQDIQQTSLANSVKEAEQVHTSQNGVAKQTNSLRETAREIELSVVTNPHEKYKGSTLTDAQATSIHEDLKRILFEEKPYTDPDLTLSDLAQKLGVHPNLLSQVINSKEKKSFYDMVNELRVEEFIRLMALPDSRQFTMLAISFDCGFNSKASFNRNFKKYTGLAPRDFIKQQAAA